MNYLNAFWVGGLICVAGQVLLSLTKLTPARILVLFVVLGVALSAIGVYQPIVDYAGAGATVPLVGFGHSLFKGAIDTITTDGAIGILTGGVKATAAGIAAAIVFGFVMAVLFNPKIKK